MFFGCTVWTIQWAPPYEEAVRRVARMGLQGVELIAWTADVLADYYTPDTIRNLRAILDGEGLTLTNFYHAPPKLGSPDDGDRASAVADFSRAIEVAVALGSPMITMTAPYPFNRDVPHLLTRPTTQEWIVNIPGDLDWARNYDDYVAAVQQCCARAAEAGLRVTIEPHPYRWVASGQSMLRLIERTGAPNLGLNLDPSHLFPGGDIPHYTVYALGSRVHHTHCSDNDAQSNAHWRPGKGKVDWAAFLRALNDVGYDSVLSLELEDVPGCSKRDRPSTPELDGEMRRAMRYLADLCAEQGIPTRR